MTISNNTQVKTVMTLLGLTTETQALLIETLNNLEAIQVSTGMPLANMIDANEMATNIKEFDASIKKALVDLPKMKVAMTKAIVDFQDSEIFLIAKPVLLLAQDELTSVEAVVENCMHVLKDYPAEAVGILLSKAIKIIDNDDFIADNLVAINEVLKDGLPAGFSRRLPASAEAFQKVTDKAEILTLAVKEKETLAKAKEDAAAAAPGNGQEVTEKNVAEEEKSSFSSGIDTDMGISQMASAMQNAKAKVSHGNANQTK